MFGAGPSGVFIRTLSKLILAKEAFAESWRGLKTGEPKTFNYAIYLRVIKKQILTTVDSHLYWVGRCFLVSVSTETEARVSQAGSALLAGCWTFNPTVASCTTLCYTQKHAKTRKWCHLVDQEVYSRQPLNTGSNVVVLPCKAPIQNF